MRINVFSIQHNTYNLLLTLIRSSFCSYPQEHIPLPLDLDELMKTASLQAVPILVIDALHKYLEAYPSHRPFAKDMFADKARRLQLVGQVMAFERMYAKHERAMADLARLYSTRDLRMMVLKGYGLSLDWPISNHRIVGDLDIYISSDKLTDNGNMPPWQEADAVVSEQCGIKIDDGHEHHTVFCFKGVTVENHYDFINTKAHRDAPKIEAHLKSLAEKNCREIEIEGTKIYLPSADFNAIFLMRHMGQHFAGEHLNLRQILDWGFFVKAHSHEVDWNATILFLKEIGLYHFFNHINAICTDNLGFAEDIFPKIERNHYWEQRILKDILHPEFEDKKPNDGLLAILMFKTKRWWRNRWKHQMVYNDSLLMTFATLAWSHLKRFKTIKD